LAHYNIATTATKKDIQPGTVQKNGIPIEDYHSSVSNVVKKGMLP